MTESSYPVCFTWLPLPSPFKSMRNIGRLGGRNNRDCKGSRPGQECSQGPRMQKMGLGRKQLKFPGQCFRDEKRARKRESAKVASRRCPGDFQGSFRVHIPAAGCGLGSFCPALRRLYRTLQERVLRMLRPSFQPWIAANSVIPC